LRGSVAFRVYTPNARTRTGPKSASRIITGFGVPHFRSVIWRVETKYTSALNGLSKPCFHPASVLSTGRLRLSRVNVPGPKTSATFP
jgi:hypothetical protein